MPDTVIVAFYKQPGFISTAVRWFTRRPGQAFADVPSHTALIVPGPGFYCCREVVWPPGADLHEMVSAGFRSRPSVICDFAWYYWVKVTDLPALTAFLAAQEDCRYGWLTIAEIALCRVCPQRWFRASRGQRQLDCSWLVKAALEAGGWDCPRWLRRQYQPASPNDCLFAVRSPPNGHGMVQPP